MIIKGKAAQSTKFWSKHLLRDDTNEKAELRDTRGLLSRDLESALEEMRDVAKGSRCKKNFMYQANINPRTGEKLTPEQWGYAIDKLEKNLGFEGHQRVVVEHVKEGRQHYHVIWSRINPDTLRVADIGGDRYTMRRTANELEREFELSRTKPVRDYEDPRPHSLQDKERAKRTGVDHDAMKRDLTEIWRKTETGLDFKQQIEERGYQIAQGDRVEFALIDPQGGVHSLSRRLEGVRAKDLRERFVDLDRQALPTIQQARDQVKNQDNSFRIDQDAITRDREPSPHKTKADDQTNRAPLPRSAQSPIRNDQLELGLGRAANAPLEVLDTATGKAGKLADLVLNLFAAPRPQSRGLGDQVLAERRANAALSRMAEAQSRGERLRSSDVAALTHDQILNMRDKGDDYMRQLLADHEKERQERYYKKDWERERER